MNQPTMSVRSFVPWLLALVISLSHVVPTFATPVGVRSFSHTSLAQAAYRQGMASLLKGDFRQAEAAFKESVRLEPEHIRGLLGLAEVALRQDQIAEAETYLKQAIATQPTAVLPHIDLGELYLLKLRQPRPAAAAYRAALALDASQARAHYGLGVALTMMGQTAAARVSLEEASRLQPTNASVWHTLGRLHVEAKAYNQALDAFAMALKVQPTFLQASLDRGDVLVAMGHDDQALQEYQKLLDVAPTFAPAQVRIGTIHVRNKRIDAARQAYIKAITLDPSSAVAYNNLAWLAAERREALDQALAWAQKAVALAPNTPRFYDTLGWVHRARGELHAAANALHKALALNTKHAEIAYRLGVVYQEMGQVDKAKAFLNKALTLTTESSGANEVRPPVGHTVEHE